MTGAPEHAGVHFPPPILYVAAIAGGVLLQRAVPLAILGPERRAIGVLGGWALIAAWALLSGWAIFAFRRQRTPLMPNQPVAALVLAGPYRWSRNPMYVGLALLQSGVALLVNTWWILLLLPVALALLTLLVIRREERYLRARFGEAYERYCARVRRWL